MKTFIYIGILILLGLIGWLFKPEISMGWYVAVLVIAIVYMDSTYQDKIADLEFQIENIEERLSEIEPDNSSDFYNE